jgi:hypothetical protein
MRRLNMSEVMFAGIVTGALLVAVVAWVPFLHVCHKAVRREKPRAGERKSPGRVGSLAVD